MSENIAGSAIGWSDALSEMPGTLAYTAGGAIRDLPVVVPRSQARRLSDKVLAAFHHACDLHDFEVASELLRVLEIIVTRKPMPQHAGRRRSMESLVAAHERLWQLRNPGE